jgi:hypothetical protein
MTREPAALAAHPDLEFGHERRSARATIADLAALLPWRWAQESERRKLAA